MIRQATFVLFAQEVLGIGPLLFTVIGFGGAIGGVIGGNIAAPVSKRFGSGTCLAIRSSGGGRRLMIGPDVLAGRAGACSRVEALLGDPLERDHGQPAPDDHPRASARTGQQRLPLLRLGDDADRCGDRRCHRRRGRRRSPTATSAAGDLDPEWRSRGPVRLRSHASSRPRRSKPPAPKASQNAYLIACLRRRSHCRRAGGTLSERPYLLPGRACRGSSPLLAARSFRPVGVEPQDSERQHHPEQA